MERGAIHDFAGKMAQLHARLRASPLPRPCPLARHSTTPPFVACSGRKAFRVAHSTFAHRGMGDPCEFTRMGDVPLKRSHATCPDS